MKSLLTRLDWQLFIPAVVLLSLGLMMIRSVAPDSFQNQLIFALLGLGLYVVFSHFDSRILARLAGYFYLASTLSLMLTLVFGAISRGAARWLEIGAFRLQPSELVKPFLIVCFASLLAQKRPDNFRSVLGSLVLVAVPVVLIFIQPDLGSSLVVLAFWLTMIFISGLSKYWLIRAGVVAALLLPLAWAVLQPYQRQRLFTFADPFRDPLGSGYNIIQSMVAVGSGRLTGRGLGHGTQSHLQFLPERHTDFIFASLSEELGFSGSLFLVAVFVFLLATLLKNIRLQSDPFSRLILTGVFALFFVQFFVNVGMTIGIMPVTGITLPLVSYGGSSLFSSLIGLGIASGAARSR